MVLEVKAVSYHGITDQSCFRVKFKRPLAVGAAAAMPQNEIYLYMWDGLMHIAHMEEADEEICFS